MLSSSSLIYWTLCILASCLLFAASLRLLELDSDMYPSACAWSTKSYSFMKLSFEVENR